MRPGTTIAMYWSGAAMLIPMQVAMVAATSEPVPRARLRIPPASEASMPLRSMTPPNPSAQKMRATVPIMLFIPPRDRSSSIAATPVDET